MHYNNNTFCGVIYYRFRFIYCFLYLFHTKVSNNKDSSNLLRNQRQSNVLTNGLTEPIEVELTRSIGG